MDKTCIWCRQDGKRVRFTNRAHIFPQSLGGHRVCTSVCDDCNRYFGSKQSGRTSVEIALKEPLNISRLFLMSQTNRKGKLPRFKSEYFNYDLQKQLVRPKFKYSLISNFQAMFTKQFKRGIYKVFLEERSEAVGDALDAKFDFIREYARYGIGDYPAFYLKPAIPAVFISDSDIHSPAIKFTEHSDQVMRQFGFYSHYFVTHQIAFPIIRHYELTMENYIRYILSHKNEMVEKVIPIKSIEDIDFTFSFAFSK